ncbi:MAG: hypothetical protein Athens071416_1 [Parcubacteria group bacterium Athens0714_16]|nr:MAG: hypothetical protein Athens071416_1 [Parcubacteria group bacterium Athens0714_16]
MSNLNTTPPVEVDLSYLQKITLPGFPGNKKVIFQKKQREKQKQKNGFSLKSKGRSEVFDLDQESETKTCPNCQYQISTVDIPDKCPNCEYELGWY